MKKLVVVFTVIMLLVLVSSAFALDQKGRIAFGGYGGYAVGFGDFFKSWDFGDLGSFQNKPTFAFGGKAKYGFAPNMSVMGTVEYQSGKAESELNIPGMPSMSESTNWNWIGIMANIQYMLTPEKTTCPYLTAGGGFYIPDEGDGKPGINLGVGVEHFLRENIALDGGARFHMVFFKSEDNVVEDGDGGLSASVTEGSESWDNATYVMIYLGATIYLMR
jgi:hypothetical protein